MKKKLLPLSLLFFLGIVWGSGFAIIKIILISIGPLWIMFSRIALGSLVLLIWLYLQNKSLTFDKEFWCFLKKDFGPNRAHSKRPKTTCLGLCN